MATPAQAIPIAAIELPTFAVAAFGGAQGCGAGLDPRLGQPAAQGPAKSAAILGGQVSQLDLIRQQQAGGGGNAIASAAASTVPGTGLAPAAAPMNCQRLALPSSPLSGFQPGLRRSPVPADPDDFLGSRRLVVRKTAFDSAWNRVSHEGLSRGYVTALMGSTPGTPTTSTLATVNAWSNARIRYEEDSKLYHRADYWASAGATLKRGAGDCEDIAIAKMQILAALGVPRADMYLTIARDLDRRADHALLIVKLDGRYWLLDNATDRLLNGSQSYDYQPVLSFNSSQKWLHGY